MDLGLDSWCHVLFFFFLPPSLPPVKRHIHRFRSFLSQNPCHHGEIPGRLAASGRLQRQEPPPPPMEGPHRAAAFGAAPFGAAPFGAVSADLLNSASSLTTLRLRFPPSFLPSFLPIPSLCFSSIFRCSSLYGRSSSSSSFCPILPLFTEIASFLPKFTSPFRLLLALPCLFYVPASLSSSLLSYPDFPSSIFYLLFFYFL